MNLKNLQLLNFSEEHVRYEISMFYETGHKIVEKSDLFAMNILTESFAIHTRNLIYFFYPEHAKPDDVTSEHFFENPKTEWLPIRPVLSKTLINARDRANKEIAHLTLKRIAGIDPKKGWHRNDVMNEMHKILLLFVGRASDRLLHPNVINLVRDHSKRFVTDS